MIGFAFYIYALPWGTGGSSTTVSSLANYKFGPVGDWGVSLTSSTASRMVLKLLISVPSPINKTTNHSSLSKVSITFHGERLSTLYLEITLVAGFLTNATFFILSLYFKNINGPMLGRAQRDALALLTNTS